MSLRSLGLEADPHGRINRYAHYPHQTTQQELRNKMHTDQLSPTLKRIDAELDTLRDRAQGTQRTYQHEIEQINRDKTLSDEGKKEARARALRSTKEHLDGLRASEHGILDSAISKLERDLDGKIGFSTNDIIAFRDAQDRAERLENAEDAKVMMDRALRSDDRTLAHAIFRRALTSKWADATATFRQANPTTATAAEDLEFLLDFKNNRAWERAAVYGVLG